jgi:hypothetical protein
LDGEVEKFMKVYSELAKHFITDDHCTFEFGRLIRDARRLNQPMDKLIVISTKVDPYLYNQENVLYIPPWKGQFDGSLEALGVYLRSKCQSILYL